MKTNKQQISSVLSAKIPQKEKFKIIEKSFQLKQKSKSFKEKYINLI